MPRQTYEVETQTRYATERIIEENALTESVVYPSPSSMQAILRMRGIILSYKTVTAHYERLGIRQKKLGGIWTKDL